MTDDSDAHLALYASEHNYQPRHRPCVPCGAAAEGNYNDEEGEVCDACADDTP